jgi:hypothetical protein
VELYDKRRKRRGKAITGLNFEGKADFLDILRSIEGYTGQNSATKSDLEVFFDGKLVARVFKKHAFYRFLEENSVDWEKIISKKLLPDDAILVIIRETLCIIEVKYQQAAGSVDEKLQTCDFKRKQYLKLVQSPGYGYVLNDWFKYPSYKDVLDYINSVNCHYRFKMSCRWLGLACQQEKTYETRTATS